VIKIVLGFLVLLTVSYSQAKDIKEFPLGEWPVLASFEQSKCLDIDNELLDVPLTARAEGTTIHTNFILVSYGGSFYVNPQVNKGWGSITFSFESASNQIKKSGHSCFQTFNLGIKAWPKKYDRVFIVVDKTVRYEIWIDKEE